MDKVQREDSTDYEELSDDEIKAFFADLDCDRDGFITFQELEQKLHDVHDEIAPKLQKHHILHPARRDIEKREGHNGGDSDGLHAFLCHLMPSCGARLDRDEFVRHVRTWHVPSQRCSDSEETDKADRQEEQRIPLGRRVRAYWSVHGPNLLFVACVVGSMLAFGLWQMIIYIQNQPARQAFGWGVIMAKANAGVLYPTFVFILLSMNRHLATMLRRSYLISTFINWDVSQRFHIIMSCAGLLFATLHAIGHLTGTFVFGSKASRQANLSAYLEDDYVPRSYAEYTRTRPGWTGLSALALYWTMSLLSMPQVRQWNYEAFQLAHLLMFPMLGLLSAHGTAALLQAPMLGYFLAGPALLVIFERLWRFLRGFMSIPATCTILDDAVLLTVKTKDGKDWAYNAGQYILLQVPKISLFQWHPFTISSCRGSEMQVHIKVEGDWTGQLRDLGLEGKAIKVGIDGPFGAPAQRFYEYDYSLIIGGGIGITPFSAILTDLEENYSQQRDPWQSNRGSRSPARALSRSASRRSSLSRRQIIADADTAAVKPTNDQSNGDGGNSSDNDDDRPAPRCVNPDRRVDFHWTVREKNNLLWFSELLNRAISGAEPLARENKLDLNIHTHITAKRNNISTYVLRYMLDGYRTPSAPYSALTGLKQRSHFGRPDFKQILQRHFQDLLDDEVREKKVGVFVRIIVLAELF